MEAEKLRPAHAQESIGPIQVYTVDLQYRCDLDQNRAMQPSSSLEEMRAQLKNVVLYEHDGNYRPQPLRRSD